MIFPTLWLFSIKLHQEYHETDIYSLEIFPLRNSWTTKGTELRNSLYQSLHRLSPYNNHGRRVFTTWRVIVEDSIKVLERLDTVQFAHNLENRDADTATSKTIAKPRGLPILRIRNRISQGTIPPFIISHLGRVECNAHKQAVFLVRHMLTHGMTRFTGMLDTMLSRD